MTLSTVLHLVAALLSDGVCVNARCLASSMHSSLVALGSELGVVRVVETAAAGLTVVFRARLHKGPVRAVAFSPDANILSVAAGNR